MISVFSSLFVALLLLCVPAAWLQRGRVRHLPLTHFLENSRMRYASLNWLMAADFVRGLIGAWILQGALNQLPDVMPGHIIWQGYLNAILVVSVFLQLCFHRLRPGELHAPLGFITGILLVMVPLGVTLPALALSIATTLAARSLSVGIGVLAMGILAFGLLLQIGLVPTVVYTIITGLPLVGVVGSNREFTLPVTMGRYRSTLRQADALSSRLR